MATNQPARDGAGESMAEFVRRRNREQAARAQTHAAGHEAYGRAIRRGEDLELKRSADVAAHGAKAKGGGVAHVSASHHPKPHPSSKIGHPGFAESLIPVWGSGREAIADFQDGDYAGAGLNGALAASDLFLAEAVGKAIAKGGIYAIRGPIINAATKNKWKSVRRQMGDLKMLEPHQHGHHWLIPQKGWGKDIPDWIKHHPLNIKGMPANPEIHGRVHGSYKGKPQYGAVGQYWHGTPHWSKVATGSAVGHPAAATQAKAHRR
jgi:hypothetical protein